MEPFEIKHHDHFKLSETFLKLLPEMSKDAYSDLRDSIQVHGIRNPIIVKQDGTVVDGHHRLRIAEELGIECPAVDVTAYEGEELSEWDMLEIGCSPRHSSERWPPINGKPARRTSRSAQCWVSNTRRWPN